VQVPESLRPARRGSPADLVQLWPVLPGLLYPAAAADLDCDEVNGSDFTVLPSDPHGFDGNSDGSGLREL